MKNIREIRLIELFAGIGSQAKALENLKIQFIHHSICEFDDAVRAYNALHSTSFTTSDITEINGKDLDIKATEDISYILTYSFPCTSTSQAGKREGMEKGSGTTSSLLWEVERLLHESNELPQVLLMENVTQVHNKLNNFVFEKWKKSLTELGYINYVSDLNSKDFGIPQSRNRCFMISFLKKSFSENLTFEFPKIQQQTKCIFDMLDKSFFLNSNYKNNKRIFPIEKVRHLLDSEKFKSKYNTWVKSPNICQIGQIYEESNRLIGRIYSPYGISPTLTTCCGGNHQVKVLLEINNEKLIKKLSPLEYWRLMGFSDSDFAKVSIINGKRVSDRILYKQAGNSIVVPVLEEIFSEIIYTIEKYFIDNVSLAS